MTYQDFETFLIETVKMFSEIAGSVFSVDFIAVVEIISETFFNCIHDQCCQISQLQVTSRFVTIFRSLKVDETYFILLFKKRSENFAFSKILTFYKTGQKIILERLERNS